jgi:hypothetical protein
MPTIRKHHVAVDLMAYADDRKRALRASGNKDVRPMISNSCNLRRIPATSHRSNEI